MILSANCNIAFVFNKMATTDDRFVPSFSLFSIACLSDATISIFASSPFEFIIDGSPLYIHAGLIALHSQPLNRMISGHMSEAQKGSAELRDIDQGTFIRFIRWAYSGIYSAAEFRNDPSLQSSSKKVKKRSKRPSTKDETATEAPAADNTEITEAPAASTEFYENPPVHHEFDYQPAMAVEPEPIPEAIPLGFGRPKKKSPKKSSWAEFTAYKKIDMKESFIERNYDVPETAFSTPPPRSNQGHLEDYSEVFLSHARVYVFADKYDIEPLKTLALKKLHQTLAIYTLYPERCGDIITLISYSYKHTPDRGEGVEGLRALLTHYVGFEMATLARDEGFQTLLMEDGGAFLGDFLSMVIKRVE